MCREEKIVFAKNIFFAVVVVLIFLYINKKGMHNAPIEEDFMKKEKAKAEKTVDMYNKVTQKASAKANSCGVIAKSISRMLDEKKLDEDSTEERAELRNMESLSITDEEKAAFPGICRETIAMESCCVNLYEIFKEANTMNDIYAITENLNEISLELNGHVIMLDAYLRKGEVILENLNRKIYSDNEDEFDKGKYGGKIYAEKIQEELGRDNAYSGSVTIDMSGLYQDNIFRLSYKIDLLSNTEKIAFIEKINDIEEEVFPKGEELVRLSNGSLLARSENIVLINGEDVIKEMLLRKEEINKNIEKEDIAETEKLEEKSEEYTYNENIAPSYNNYNSREKDLPSAQNEGYEDRKTNEEIEEEDPLNVKDYYSHEDFYEDNVDEFENIDDAEDYYDDHGGF